MHVTSANEMKHSYIEEASGTPVYAVSVRD